MSTPKKSQKKPKTQADDDTSALDAKELKTEENSEDTVIQEEPGSDQAVDDSAREADGKDASQDADESGSDSAPAAEDAAEDGLKTTDNATETADDAAAQAHDATPDTMHDADAPVDPTPDETPEQEPIEAAEPDAPPAEPDAPPAEPDAPPAEPAAPQVIERETIVQKGGFVPMALGGIVAATLGFFAAPALQGSLPFLAPPPNPFEAEARDALDTQAAGLEGLQSRIEDVSGAVSSIDLGALESDLTAKLDALSGRIDGLGEQLAGYEGRIVTLEKQPMVDAVSPEAIAAYEGELDALRASVDEQRAEIETMAADAVAAQRDATTQALRAQARSALAKLTAQLQNGDTFGDQIVVLQDTGVNIPEPLAATSSDGVPTLTELVAEFPDIARNALAEARAESDGSEGMGSFLQRQLGARSVTPRDGDDPDAVLSRAEAAVNSGDLSTAITELAALPDAAQAVLADWVARAQTREAALEAVQGLAIELNQE